MRVSLLIVCVWGAISSVAVAQVPKDTRLVPKSLRDWLPRDAKKNASGLQPEKERLPPLRRIADPSNLESKVPSIKAAAEIKQQEDLKCQKIKAIRYLASVGCGCYNEDGKITEALLASLTDCTEEVRLATVEVIQFTACQSPCQHCNQKSCCNEDLVKKLAEMAYELDDKGCPIEPSARVRAAAVKAMKACCPNQTPYTQVPTKPLVEPDVEPEGIESTPVPELESDPPMPPEEQRVDERSADGMVAPPLWKIQSSTISPIPGGAETSSVDIGNKLSAEGVAYTTTSTKPQGSVQQILVPQEAVIIRFDGQAPSFESRLVVYHRHALGRISASCELDIVAIDGQKVVARPPAGAAALSKVAVGDLIVVR